MSDLYFYSSKKKAILLLGFSAFFVFCEIRFYDKIFNFEMEPFKNIILLLAFFLFAFGIIISVLHLIRTKPLLTITDAKITIDNVLAKRKDVAFEDIKSFYVTVQYHRGISTNRQIVIEMKKPIEKYEKSWFYRLMFKFDERIANSQYGIQVGFLNVNHKKLLDVLKKRLKESHRIEVLQD